MPPWPFRTPRRAAARRRRRHAAPADSALERNKVAAINPAAGEKFDPNLHQAISMVRRQEANTVVSVLQKGYSIADRILRPALVTVAQPRRALQQR
jgi:hypothetical protein